MYVGPWQEYRALARARHAEALYATRGPETQVADELERLRRALELVSGELPADKAAKVREALAPVAEPGPPPLPLRRDAPCGGGRAARVEDERAHQRAGDRAQVNERREPPRRACARSPAGAPEKCGLVVRSPNELRRAGFVQPGDVGRRRSHGEGLSSGG